MVKKLNYSWVTVIMIIKMWKSGKTHNKYVGTHKYHKLGTKVNMQNKTKENK